MKIVSIKDLDIEKIKRSQYLIFLDTTPKEKNPTWSLLGIGIDEANVAYNPNVESLKWIIEDTARHDHDSNEKQIDVEQKSYKGDPCFAFINAGRDQLNYGTHILEIDTWSTKTEGQYDSKLSDGLVTVTEYNGDSINYDLYFEGDCEEGTTSIASSVPTFTPTAA